MVNETVIKIKDKQNIESVELSIIRPTEENLPYSTTLKFGDNIYTKFKIKQSSIEDESNADICFKNEKSDLTLDLAQQKKNKKVRKIDELITLLLFFANNILLNPIITELLRKPLVASICHGVTGFAGICSGIIGAWRAYNSYQKAKSKLGFIDDRLYRINDKFKSIGYERKDLSDSLNELFNNEIIGLLNNGLKNKDEDATLNNIIGKIKTYFTENPYSKRIDLIYHTLEMFDVFLQEKIYKIDKKRNEWKIILNTLGIILGSFSLFCTIAIATDSIFSASAANLLTFFPFSVSLVSILISVVIIGISTEPKLKLAKQRRLIAQAQSKLVNPSKSKLVNPSKRQQSVEKCQVDRAEDEKVRDRKNLFTWIEGLAKIIVLALFLTLAILNFTNQISAVAGYIIGVLGFVAGAALVVEKFWFFWRARTGSNALIEKEVINNHIETFKNLCNSNPEDEKNLKIQGKKAILAAISIEKARNEQQNLKDHHDLPGLNSSVFDHNYLKNREGKEKFYDYVKNLDLDCIEVYKKDISAPQQPGLSMPLAPAKLPEKLHNLNKHSLDSEADDSSDSSLTPVLPGSEDPMDYASDISPSNSQAELGSAPMQFGSDGEDSDEPMSREHSNSSLTLSQNEEREDNLPARKISHSSKIAYHGRNDSSPGSSNPLTNAPYTMFKSRQPIAKVSDEQDAHSLYPDQPYMSERVTGGETQPRIQVF